MTVVSTILFNVGKCKVMLTTILTPALMLSGTARNFSGLPVNSSHQLVTRSTRHSQVFTPSTRHKVNLSYSELFTRWTHHNSSQPKFRKKYRKFYVI